VPSSDLRLSVGAAKARLSDRMPGIAHKVSWVPVSHCVPGYGSVGASQIPVLAATLRVSWCFSAERLDELHGVVAKAAGAIESVGSFVAHQHAHLELFGAELARERFSPYHELAADAAATMRGAYSQIRNIRIRL